MTWEQIAIALEKLTNKQQRELERDIAKLYRNLDRLTMQAISEVFSKYELGGILTQAEMAKYDRLSKLLKLLEDEINKNQPNIKNTLFATLASVFVGAFNVQAQAVENVLGQNPIPEKQMQQMQMKDFIIKAAIENPVSGLTLSETLEKHRRDIIWSIRQETTRAIMNGSTYKQMADSLKGVFQFNYEKAIRISRTEIHRVQEQGKLEYAKKVQENGIQMVKKWRNMKDERVRRTKKANHVIMNNHLAIPIEEYFDLGNDEKGIAPGNTGYAHHDIHCRCIAVYEVVEGNSEVLSKEDELKKQIQGDIKKGKYNLKHNIQHFQKHNKGTKEYSSKTESNKQKGRFAPSYLTISYDEANELVKRLAGSGIILLANSGEWKNKELITSDEIIGVYVNGKTGEEIETNRFVIHYSKSGTHIVPAHPTGE